MTDFAERAMQERRRLAVDDPAGEAEAVIDMTPGAWDKRREAEPRTDLEPTEFRKLGFGTYQLSATMRNARIEVTNVDRGRDGVRAELHVYAGNPGTRSVPGTSGLVAREQTNLLAGTTRAGLARRLTERAPGVPWDTLLEEAAFRVLDAEREPSPVIRLANLPERIDPGSRVDPILPANVPIILFGAGGTGKSTLAAAVGVSVASGVTVVPGWLPRRAPVLLLDWEEDEYIVHRRIEQIANGANLPTFPTDLLYRQMAGRLADEADSVARIVAEEGIGLLVVDSVGAAMGTVGEGDQADSANRLFNALRHIGGTALLVDHVAAENIDRRTVRKPYGSVYKENRSRGTFHVTGEDHGDGSRTLVVTNAKPLSTRAVVPPVAIVVTFEGDAIRFSEGATPEVAERGDRGPTLADRLANLLAHHGPKDAAFLAGEVGGATKANAVRVVLGRHHERFVAKPGPTGTATLWSLANDPDEEDA